MPEGENKLEQKLDLEQTEKGLQLPKNFETIFKDQKNRVYLKDAVKSKFDGFTQINENKQAIIQQCKEEMKSWGDEAPTDPSKIAVLYLYTALNSGEHLLTDQVSSTFKKFKEENKTESVATTSEKKGEPIKEGISTIDEDIDGTKLHVKNTVEGGKLIKIEGDIKFNDLGNIKFVMNNETTDLTFHANNPESLSTLRSLSNKSFTNEKKIDTNTIVVSGEITKGEITKGEITIDKLKNEIRSMNKKLKSMNNKETTTTLDNKSDTVPANSDNKINTNPTETIQLEQTEASKLQASINAIPALKDNKAINKLVSDINTLEKSKNELGNTYTSKLGEREASKTEIANKEESLNQLEAQIKDTKSIDDKFARKSALDRLYTQKDNLQKDIKNLENKRDDLKGEVDQIALDINEIKTEIADSKDTLLSKLEPVERAYEKNIKTINANIGKYGKALDGQYTDSQRATLQPDFEKWTEAKSSQEALLNTTKTEQGNLNTLIADLKGEKQDNNEDSNLANGKVESTPIISEDKPGIDTTNAPDRTKNVNKNLGDVFDLPKLSPEELNKNLQENFGTLGYEIKDNGGTIDITLPTDKDITDPRFAIDLKNNTQNPLINNINKITGQVGFINVEIGRNNDKIRPTKITITKNV